MVALPKPQTNISLPVDEVIHGDCLEVLRALPGNHVQCCVTSPPYYGLRDYGTAKWEGGNSTCDHVAVIKEYAYQMCARSAGERIGKQTQISAGIARIRICPNCGAVRIDNQIGLEETPEAYTEKLVEVFREVRRVLRHDGVLWLNLGDSYASSGNKTGEGEIRKVSSNLHASPDNPSLIAQRRVLAPEGIKPKNLLGIPWRVAFALQADGWILRSAVIWHKPNAMPESVKDRPTNDYEHVFMLAKNERYFYNADAVREPIAEATISRNSYPDSGEAGRKLPASAVMRTVHTGNMLPGKRIMNNPSGRNRRSVWSIATKPYSGAHFAVMPTALVEPCILAGSRTGDIILDPFSGAGTVPLVALQHERHYIGIELNPEYITIAERRLAQHRGLWEVN